MSLYIHFNYKSQGLTFKYNRKIKQDKKKKKKSQDRKKRLL